MKDVRVIGRYLIVVGLILLLAVGLWVGVVYFRDYDADLVERVFMRVVDGTASETDYDDLRGEWVFSDGEFTYHFYSRAFVTFGNRPELFDAFSSDPRFGEKYINGVLRFGPGSCRTLGVATDEEVALVLTTLSNRLAHFPLELRTNYLKSLRFGSGIASPTW
jgi:hypothetical protein